MSMDGEKSLPPFASSVRPLEPEVPAHLQGAGVEGAHGRPADAAGAEGEVQDRKWYIVHTYSGFEERVKETLRQRADALDMGSAFGEIRIPTETVVEYKSGKKRETQRKFFPGYILVEMEMSDAAWHVVKNTPKVTGFVGTGRKPTPLSQDEVDKILEQVVTAKEKPKPKYVFEKAEPVRITDGPFNNFTGVVDDVNLDRNTLKVMVTIFGRQTPVELDFSQVQKI
jgi:transcriptional antiterminator NusG